MCRELVELWNRIRRTERMQTDQRAGRRACQRRPCRATFAYRASPACPFVLPRVTLQKRSCASIVLPALVAAWLVAGLPRRAVAQASAPRRAVTDSAPYLRDRGTGVATSMFGTYARKGELLVYPFLEWDSDFDLEYVPKELGYGVNSDQRGQFEGSERLIFLGYGISRNLEVELEAAYLATAELTKSSTDPSAMPNELFERGLGDVEGQLRWRWQEETAHRPEAFTYFETVFPLQRTRKLICTRDW